MHHFGSYPQNLLVNDRKHFRPIRLVRCVYKLIAKFLALWPKNLVFSVVEELQVAFVHGR